MRNPDFGNCFTLVPMSTRGADVERRTKTRDEPLDCALPGHGIVLFQYGAGCPPRFSNSHKDLNLALKSILEEP